MIEEIKEPQESESLAPEWHTLDPRVVPLWRLGYLIACGLLLLLLLPAVILLLLRNAAFAELYGLGWLGLASGAFWYCRWRPARSYRAWSYRLDRRVLETQSGVWFRLTRLLPLNRLQHVDLHRGPLERLFGLASLVLYTAGTSSASITIPGLDQAEAARLRDYLIAIGGDDAV